MLQNTALTHDAINPRMKYATLMSGKKSPYSGLRYSGLGKNISILNQYKKIPEKGLKNREEEIHRREELEQKEQ
jgi:hypothetical protein